MPLLPDPTTAWDRLLAGLPAVQLPRPEVVDPEAMPAWARLLLHHDEHMTEIMARHHGGPVVVEVQRRHRRGDDYWRQIVLRIADRPAIIQGGLVRIHLPGLMPSVAEAILLERVPLGYLLMDHQVLRRIELHHLIRFPSDPSLTSWLGGDPGAPAWGRLATLHCDEEPVIELCEVLPPLREGAV
jgi:chorismate-pyruvate lyase